MRSYLFSQELGCVELNRKVEMSVGKLVGRRMDGWMWMGEWVDGRTDGWVDGWMDGWMDGLMDG
jgi:hypothetical protein